MRHRVGIRHLETARLQILAKIQLRPANEQRAFRIDHHIYLQRTHQDVAIGRSIDQIHFILQPGTTAANHRHPQRPIGPPLLREQPCQPRTGPLRNFNEAFIANLIINVWADFHVSSSVKATVKRSTAHSSPINMSPFGNILSHISSVAEFQQELANFSEFGSKTLVSERLAGVSCYTNEFWTAKQRAAHSLHEISYRACFKPQLPRFFIERLTQPGDLVYDPFLGRGTTLIEAALLGRNVAGNDLNPLSEILARPRLQPPELGEIERRLGEIDWLGKVDLPEELLVFYHPETLQEIAALRHHLQNASATSRNLVIDDWIRMVATNRLTGHSPGFFSVYTLPPNQAVSVRRQVKINAQRGQTPPRRDVRKIILKKSAALMKDCLPFEQRAMEEVAREARFFTQSATKPSPLGEGSVALVVTSPPFLNVVDYAGDNWLRCWFNGIDPAALRFTQSRKAGDWAVQMTLVFVELARVLRADGHIAFEVGEIHGGKLPMEDLVIPAADQAGLRAEFVLINAQEFTKTANCWGVSNQSKGTNTNRVVVLTKAGNLSEY